MVMLRHPLSGTEYHRNEDGTVRVVGSNGVEGHFTRQGIWISGARRTADPAMCQWVADGAIADRKNAVPNWARPTGTRSQENAT